MDDAAKKGGSGISFFGKALGGIKSLLGSTRVGSALLAGGVAGGILYLANKIKELGGAVINAGSNLEELESKARVIFGGTFEKVGQTVDEISEKVGRSRSQILQFSADLAAVIEPTGIATERLGEMSTKLAELAIDLASFHNATDIQAFNALRSAITGELEPLKRFGVVMTQANLKAFALKQGVDGNIESFNQAQLAALRYAFILDQTQKAQGDAERTADSYANQLRRLQGNFREFLETISNTGVVNAMAGVLQSLNLVVSGLTTSIAFLTEKTKEALTFLSQAAGFENVGIRSYSVNRTAQEQSRLSGENLTGNLSIEDVRRVSATVTQKREEEAIERAKELREEIKKYAGASADAAKKAGGQAEDRAKELEKQIDLRREQIKQERDYLKQKQTIVGLTATEERQLKRLETAIDGAFDVSNAKDFAEVLALVTDGGEELQDVFEQVGDKIESLEEKLKSAEEQSKDRLNSLREERQKLVDSFSDEDVDQDIRRAEKLANAYFEAKKRIDGGDRNAEDFNTVNDVRNILSEGGQVATAIETQLKLLEELKNAKSEAERINIQAAFDERDEDAVRAEKLSAVDAKIEAENLAFEATKTQIQEEISLQRSAQEQITQAFKSQQELRAEYSRLSTDAQIEDLKRLQIQAQQTLAVLSGAATGATNITNNKEQNVTVNNYGDAANQNTNPDVLAWKLQHNL